MLKGGPFLAAWPSPDAGGNKDSLPIQFYAWTDSRILLIALYEDVQYGYGRVPAPKIGPSSAPKPKPVKPAPSGSE